MPEAQQPATPLVRRRGWRAVLTTFKWCRITLLLLLFVVIILGLFLDRVGLPDWLERRVVDQFRANGWELQFSRLRLRWYHGIVAEDLQLRRTNTFNGPHLFLRAAEFQLNWKALRHLDLEARGVMLAGGSFRWPLPGTNQPQRTLALDDVGGDLLFKQNDEWELRFLEANLRGVHVRFRGDITNASLIRDWKLPEPRRPSQGAPGDFWHRVLTAAEKVRFEGTPELNMLFLGDAKDWKTFEVQTKFTARAGDSPWGGGTNISLSADFLPPPRSNDAPRLDVKLVAESAHNPWGLATNLNLTMVLEPSLTHLFPSNALGVAEFRGVRTDWADAGRCFVELRSNPTATNAALSQSRLDITIEELSTPVGDAERARATVTTIHSTTNLLPAALDTSWTLREMRTRWATSTWAHVNARLDLPARSEIRLGQTNLPASEVLSNIPLIASMKFSNVTASAFLIDRGGLNVRWRFPLVELAADMQSGGTAADAQIALQTATREGHFRAQTTLEPLIFAPLLDTNARPWLSAVEFKAAPQLNVEGAFALPASTSRSNDWARELLSSVNLAGQFHSGSGACRGVTFTSISAPFTYSNHLWTTPGLRITRPEGALEIAGATDEQTGEFRGTVRSAFDPLSLRAAFPRKPAQQVFDFFQLSEPLHVDGDFHGSWRDFARFNAGANVALTNAMFRGQTVKACFARVTYTNQFLSILEPVVIREGEQGIAAGIGIDLTRPRLFLTNAVGRLSAQAVAKCIGADVEKALTPFAFEVPPDARAEGSVPLGASDKSEDMRFEIDGGPFHWRRFHLEKAKATLLWRGDTLTITNFQGRWHGAGVKGAARFQFTPKGQGDLFSFHVRVDGGDLRPVLRDLEPGKNTKVEGRVSGDLFVTHADTEDWKSWQGYGHANLTNGLLWDFPVMGVFSPVLNTMMPGLGNSRARRATTTFVVSNSVIYSRDLEIRATAMRMNYTGSVDFDQNVDGLMEAELLRDLPAVGFLVSKMLWPVTKVFEYRITGTLANPKTQERYLIPRILLMPLHPIKTLKDLFELEQPPSARPPAKPEPNPPQ